METFGPNVINPPKDWPIWAKFIFCFFHGFAPLLWVATILAFISWQPFAPDNPYNLTLGIILGIIILVSSVFNFYQVTACFDSSLHQNIEHKEHVKLITNMYFINCNGENRK